MTIASPSGSRATISMRPGLALRLLLDHDIRGGEPSAFLGGHRGPEVAAGRRQMAARSKDGARPRGAPRQGRTRRRGWIRHPTRGRRRGRASRRRSAASTRGRCGVKQDSAGEDVPRVEDRGGRDPTCASSARRWLARVSALAASCRGVRSRGDPDQLGSVRAAATALAGAAERSCAGARARHGERLSGPRSRRSARAEVGTPAASRGRGRSAHPSAQHGRQLVGDQFAHGTRDQHLPTVAGSRQVAPRGARPNRHRRPPRWPPRRYERRCARARPLPRQALDASARWPATAAAIASLARAKATKNASPSVWTYTDRRAPGGTLHEAR